MASGSRSLYFQYWMFEPIWYHGAPVLHCPRISPLCSRPSQLVISHLLVLGDLGCQRLCLKQCTCSNTGPETSLSSPLLPLAFLPPSLLFLFAHFPGPF